MSHPYPKTDESFAEHIRVKLEQWANQKSHNDLCPVDQRIQNFLNDYLKDLDSGVSPRLPAQTFVLDQAGLGRVISLPSDQNHFASDIVDSYRLKQGILHNPKSDRRTTQGVFHIVEGGLPIPDDKIIVPKITFKHLLDVALRPSRKLSILPFTSTHQKPAELFVSLLLRPVICPEVKGILSQKSMEIRFFAPGNLVGNLDFVETIFGNGGDPTLPANDAALDIEHWSGHTGCVILAPHLIYVTKQEAGLPHYDQATPRQRRDGMCWKTPAELYNNGQAFKITCRDERGIIVTLIADNYFGYCKKEVKTQMSYAANLFGLCEEEHSGGAIAFASYDLGEEFSLDGSLVRNKNTFEDFIRIYAGKVDLKPEGYAIDKKYTNIIYVHQDARFNLPEQSITWTFKDEEQHIKLLADHTYLLPSGYKIHIKKQTGGQAWHLIGTVGEGTLCHKPCTVSGGGKSEISKSIVDAMIQGPIYTSKFPHDIELVAKILKKDYSKRLKKEFQKPGPSQPSRPILSPDRSLGSVIKLLTVSSENTSKYNAWLRSIPDYIKEIVLTVKRFYRPEWEDDWKKYFSVDIVNGHLGHELKFKNKKLSANYLRIGREEDGSWRIFRVRQDFAAAEKVQVADDITVSVTLPAESMSDLNPNYKNKSVKLIYNCERFLFQRPDDAIYRGYDKQAEADLASPNSFLSNYEPLNLEAVKEIAEDAIHFDLYTEPMKELIGAYLEDADPKAYMASSAHPRLVDGKPTKNPRYLQKRPDRANPIKTYLAEVGTRLNRKIPVERPVYFPVNAVLPGRRNNPPDLKGGVPALAVYSPIHYQELPELFMDFICSVTGKSPSTTGFGSEGALTKGPFNALWPVVDLNNALTSFIISGYQGFSSAAGYIGPKYRVDHDISLLMPEIWSRMRPEEQDAQYLIEKGFLKKVNDFDYADKPVKASLLGYRITQKFVNTFLGRLFNNPNIVFNEEMLAPEEQDMDVFAEGIENIAVTQERVALHYFADGSVEAACPPLKTLLHIMAHGHFEGRSIKHPDIRKLFTREHLIQSEWYQKRLETKKNRDEVLWKQHISYLETFISRGENAEPIKTLQLNQKLTEAKAKLKKIQSPDYLESLFGTIGADPFDTQIKPEKKLRPSLSAKN